jgi:DNA-directed RNA polymerase I and III subunit RPAC1
LEEFTENFKVKVIQISDDEAIFDLIGIDPAIANAFRRIMISEVPTMAIEHVYVMNNTTLIQDEVLVHRLGLIPIRADPREFEERADPEQPSDLDTIVFKLKIACSRNPSCKSDDAPPEQKYINEKVFFWGS